MALNNTLYCFYLHERLCAFPLFTGIFWYVRFSMLLLYSLSGTALYGNTVLVVGFLCRLILTDSLLILGSNNWRSMMLE